MVRISLPPTESWAAYDVPSIGSELLCWVLFGTSGALWFAGLVHIISAMEACDTYKPWHDKHTHRTFFRPDTSKCLHGGVGQVRTRLAAGAIPVGLWVIPGS
jgi:hypothetical protein